MSGSLCILTSCSTPPTSKLTTFRRAVDEVHACDCRHRAKEGPVEASITKRPSCLPSGVTNVPSLGVAPSLRAAAGMKDPLRNIKANAQWVCLVTPYYYGLLGLGHSQRDKELVKRIQIPTTIHGPWEKEHLVATNTMCIVDLLFINTPSSPQQLDLDTTSQKHPDHRITSALQSSIHSKGQQVPPQPF